MPAVTMAVLHDGRVLYYSGADASNVTTAGALIEEPERAVARVLDLSTGAPTISVPTPEAGGPGDIFCAGQSFLQDGRLLVNGGNDYATIPETGGLHLYGLKQNVAFDPTRDSFEQLADMTFARWYPTTVTLPDGDALSFGGTEDLFQGGNIAAVERYHAATDTWSILPTSANNLLPLYPHVQRVPSGPYAGDLVYLAAGCVSCTQDDTLGWTHVQTLDLESATWTRHDAMAIPRDYPTSVLLPLRPPEYDTRFLLAGGGILDGIMYPDTAVGTPTADIVDLSVSPPTLSAAAPMANGRFHGHGLMLPTGDVLAVGGTVLAAKAPRANPGILPAELYDPDANEWSTLASLTIGRGYHSTAVLLPDARVLVGGYVPLGLVAPFLLSQPESTFEIFEPPYLFQGPRPVIDGAPSAVELGASFAIGTPNVDATAVLVRPGAVTHALDTEQRLIELPRGPGEGGLVVTVPDDADLVMPGWWMLFLVEDGVPSVARFIHVQP